MMMKILRARYECACVFNWNGTMKLKVAFGFRRNSAEESSLEASTSKRVTQIFQLQSDMIPREPNANIHPTRSPGVLIQAQFLGHCVRFGSRGANPRRALDGETLHLFKLESAADGTRGGTDSVDVPDVSIFMEMDRGIELQNVEWGEYALSIARELLQKYAPDMEVFIFKVTPPGKVALRLCKSSDRTGSPDWEAFEKFSHKYWNRMMQQRSFIPVDIDLEVLCLIDPNPYAQRDGLVEGSRLCIDAI